MTARIYGAFRWLRAHPAAAWTILFVYAAVVTFPHEQVQTVVGEMAKAMGRKNLYRMAGAVGLALGAWATAVFMPQLRRQKLRALIGGYFIASFALIFGAWGFLTANNTELVHYPQYFVPGALLMALTLSPLESLSWILITGGLDECFQYWYLHGTWAVPYDFNDVFMDFAGGALGVMFAMAFLRVEKRHGAPFSIKPATAVLAAIVASGLILFASGKLLLYKNDALPYWIALSRLRMPGFWFFDETWGPKVFHTLTPVEGPILLLAALAFFAVLDAKLKISPPDERP